MTEGHDDRVAFLADATRSSILDRACPSDTTTTTTTGSFNTASQLTSTTITGTAAGSGSYTFDTLGRTGSLPAIDTNNPSGDSVQLAYYATDAVASQTVGATSQSWGLDPTGRTDATSANLMLINPHGGIAASIPNTANVTAAAVSAINTTDEYGVVLSAPASSPYGGEGAAQRSTADQAGLILMGARQERATGRLSGVDYSRLFRMSRDPNQDDNDLGAAIYAELARTNHSRRRFSQAWKTIKRHDR